MDSVMAPTSDEDARRRMEDNRILNTPVNIEGVTVPIKHLHSEPYAARDFHAKLQLLKAQPGINAQKNDIGKEPSNLSDGEDDMSPLEDRLFQGKSKPKPSLSDGEPDMNP